MTTVLTIDDDRDARGLIRHALELFGGMEVLEASSVSEGVALAAHKKPDLILLDLLMPGLHGPEGLSMLRAHPRAKNIPILALTSAPDSPEADAVRRRGIIEVIAKPFDPADLAARVRAAVAATAPPAPVV